MHTHTHQKTFHSRRINNSPRFTYLLDPFDRKFGSHALALKAICKWGAQCEAPDEIVLLCRTFLLCPPPPTWGGTTIVCYRLRDNWSVPYRCRLCSLHIYSTGEVGRGAIKVMGPSYKYSYLLACLLRSTYHDCCTNARKMCGSCGAKTEK